MKIEKLPVEECPHCHFDKDGVLGLYYTHDNEFYIDKHEINDEVANALCHFLLHHEGEVIIFIDSDGGEVSAMMEIVRAMKNHKGKITTISGDYVASAALTIFFCGDFRVASNDTKFLFHRAVAHITSDTEVTLTPKDLTALASELIEDTATLFTLAVEHSNCKYEDLMQYTEDYTDWEFDANEALLHKFADVIQT